jgi:hypothetical protein
VNVSIIDRLPVPKPARDSAVFRDLASLSVRLAAAPADPDAATRLQATAARLYGLTPDEFRHVLDTFPLVPAEDRARAMKRFRTADF